MKVTGRISSRFIGDAPFSMLKARPNLYRVDVTFSGLNVADGFDGQIGWHIGASGVESRRNGDPDEIAENSEFDDPLLEYPHNGIALAVIGEGQEAGPCQDLVALNVVFPDGRHRVNCYDARTFLQVRELQFRRGTRVVRRDARLANYRFVEGVAFPFTITTRRKGLRGSFILQTESIELNTRPSVARFRPPTD